MRFGQLKPCLDYLDIALRGLDSLLGLLLEGMKDVDNAGKANGVDGAVSIAVLVIDYLEHTPAAKSLQGFGTRMLFAILCIVDRQPMTRTSSGNARKSSRDDPIHNAGFCIFIHHFIIAIGL